MTALGSEQLLQTWERAQAHGPIERALVLLSQARTHWDRDRLRHVPLGQRDRCVLELREQLVGTRVQGHLRCPACGELLEFSVDLAQLLFAALPEHPSSPTVELAVRDYEVQARAPNSEDMALASCRHDVEAARGLLLRRCVLSARREGVAVEPSELPDEVVHEIGEAILREDPQAEVYLDLSCARCGAAVHSLFDAPAFVWGELDEMAETLLEEVEVLAREYGWREVDILAMTPTRRRRYMERCRDG
ncbi:MAG: phage baseplate protein [Myxococcota bacterium]